MADHKTCNRLRTSPTIPPPVSVQEDVQKCIRHLGDLESVWSGAERSKAILQDLLRRATEAADSSSFELFGGVAEQRDMLDPDFFVNFEVSGTKPCLAAVFLLTSMCPITRAHTTSSFDEQGSRVYGCLGWAGT